MKNAHERFGWLEFTRAIKDTTVRVRLRLDRCIAETVENSLDRKFHLLSVVGGDSDVNAAWAAVHQNQALLESTLINPDLSTRDESEGRKKKRIIG